jgi:hypothetical protein
VLVGDLRFLQTHTIYSRIGDLAAWLSLALTLAGLLAAFTLSRRERRLMQVE